MSHEERRKIRVLLTISMFDEHVRGVRYIARELREAGMEVIFVEYRVPQDIVNSAMQEDVDVIGISSLLGGHDFVLSEVKRLLKEKNIEDKLVILGGIIPNDEIPELTKMEVGVFGAGSLAIDIINYIEGKIRVNPVSS